jgi:hypothetical protein
MSERQEDEDFDHTSRSIAVLRRFQEAFQESDPIKYGMVSTVALILGQQYPSQRNVFKFAQVAEIVLDRQVLLARPTEGFIQTPLHDPYPCPKRRDRTDVWGKVSQVESFSLGQQVESAVQIAFDPPYVSQRTTPAIRVLR